MAFYGFVGTKSWFILVISIVISYHSSIYHDPLCFGLARLPTCILFTIYQSRQNQRNYRNIRVELQLVRCRRVRGTSHQGFSKAKRE